MTTQIISGGVVIPSVAGTGDSLLVYAGGTALDAEILGGTEVVSGFDSGAMIGQLGYQAISSGGTVISTTIAGGATQNVDYAGTAISATLGAGGFQVLSYSGSAVSTVVGSGGFSYVSAGGHAIDTTVSAGGLLVLRGYSGSAEHADASGLTIESGGSAVISKFGIVSGAEVAGGGILIAQSGNTATSVTVESGGYVIGEPGATITATGAGAVIATGVLVLQSSGGVTYDAPGASGLALSGSVQVLVLSGGAVAGGGLAGGVSLSVFSGGSTSGVVLNGSFQTISQGGFASGTTVEGGAVQYVFAGGTAQGTLVDSGFALLDAGGSGIDIAVGSGGNLSLDGVASGTEVDDSGNLFVAFGGTALATSVTSGGVAFVFGSASGLLLGSGSYAVVEDTVNSKLNANTAGGVLSAGTAAAGAVILVDSGATGSGILLDSGAVELVSSGGSVIGTVIASGGTLVALSGSVVSGSLLSTGAAIVSTGIVVVGPQAQIALYSAVAEGLVVGSGVSAFVLSGGLASGDAITNSGYAEVEAGGTAIDITISAGGTLALEPGSITAGSITFDGVQGALDIGSDGVLGATVSGFGSGDTLDFVHLSGVSGGPAIAVLNTADNLLIVSGATGSATIQLDPMQNLSGYTAEVTVTKTGNSAVTLAAPGSSGETGTATGTGVVPVDVPLYILPEGGDQYKLGIEVSLDGGTTYKMYEFDTGGTGFYAAYNPAWWSPYTVVNPTPSVMTYTSGNTYTGETVATSVTLQTTTGSTVTASNADIGLITSAENPGTFTTQDWNGDLTGSPSTAPLQKYFYGDFGVGLGTGNGLSAILPQLGGGLSNGFVITIGNIPNAQTGQIGTLQLGLTQSTIQSFGTLIPMQGQNTLDTYAGSGEPTYTEILASGSLSISRVSSAASFTTGTNFVFDTGEPFPDVHVGSTITSSDLAPFTSNGAFLPGTTIALSAPPVSGGSGWDLTISGDLPSAKVATENGIGDTAGYVNTGLDAFYGERVMYDVADGLIGFEGIACFAAGTRIGTPSGETRVEALRVGDLVTTVTGEARMVSWIGHRSLDCRRHPAPETVLPVRIRAHAFGPGLPGRNLLLSPDHALFLEGVLIPVKHLIDGDAVAQTGAAQVTYYHVELVEHDVILAEGLPAETYLETGQRASFANGGPPVAAHPDFAAGRGDESLRWEALGYAPLIVSGPAVERARRRVSAGSTLARHRLNAGWGASRALFVINQERFCSEPGRTSDLGAP